MGDLGLEVGAFGGVDKGSGAVSPAVTSGSEARVAPHDEQKRPDSGTSAPHEGHWVVFKLHLARFRLAPGVFFTIVSVSYCADSCRATGQQNQSGERGCAIAPGFSLHHDFIHVAPHPVLARLKRFHDGVMHLVKMLCGVLVFRAVTAADVAAGEAQAQVNPVIAHLQALLAALAAGVDIVNFLEMGAGCFHV